MGARPVRYRTGGSVARLAIVYTLDGEVSVGLVDLSDGAFRTLTGSSTGAAVRPARDGQGPDLRPSGTMTLG
ncbi:hypothetical protein AB0D40_22560 [Streptomyces massasporeus]|uniref:hypothetical protein n=1 Tax=Streptomyces massasporeus TaxID=67324 RepID=UPI0033D1D16F